MKLVEAEPQLRFEKSTRRPNTAVLALLALLLSLLIAFIPGFFRNDKFTLPVITGPADAIQSGGFYNLENNGTVSFRWTEPEAYIFLPETLTPQAVTLDVIAAYPDKATLPILHLIYDDKEIGQWPVGRDWSSLTAKFPSTIELATKILELRVENPLPPPPGDNRTLGVAVREIRLDTAQRTSPAVLFTSAVIGMVLLLVSRRAGLNEKLSLFNAIFPVLVVNIYWYVESVYYSSNAAGWLSLVAALGTLFAAYPRRYFPVALPTAKLYRFNGGFLPDKLFSLPANAAILAPPILVLALVFGLYSRLLGYGFFWDDYHFAQPWSASQVLSTFAGPFDPHGLEPSYYRPLTSLTFALDNGLWGFNPAGYHLTNLLAQSLAVYLLYLLFRRLGLGFWLALAGAALFAIFPTNVTTVAWVSQRSDALVAVFCFAGLIALNAWWQSNRKLNLALAYISLILGLGFKELGVAIVLQYGLFVWFKLVSEDKSGAGSLFQTLRSGWRKAFLTLLPALIILPLYLGFRQSVLPPSPADTIVTREGSFLENLWSGYNLGVYQSLFTLQFGLDKFIERTSASWLAIALLGFLAVALTRRIRDRDWGLFLFGLAWVMVCCVVIAPLGTSYGVTWRVLYLPLAGTALAVVAGLKLAIRFILWSRGSWRFWPLVLATAALTFFVYYQMGTANYASQNEFAPDAAYVLRYDQWIWRKPNWKAQIPEPQLKIIEDKLRERNLLK